MTTKSDPKQLYIGRGSPALGLGPSVWGNPFKIGRDGSREVVIAKFRSWLLGQPALSQKLMGLSGKLLACHCDDDMPCHADVIIERFIDTVGSGHAPPPPSDAAIREAATARGWQSVGSDEREGSSGHAGAVEAGLGEPLWVGRGRRLRRLVDGGGICSPGCWPPGRRRSVEGPAAWLREEILSKVSALCLSRGTGSSALLAKLIEGKWSSEGVPDDIVSGIRAGLREKLGEASLQDFEQGARQDQPIEVELLGAFLREIGDPDWQVMQDYRSGVRIGVGVDLPRTPKVFGEKTTWRLTEQRPDSDWTFDESSFVGNQCLNYLSAQSFAAEVEKTLEDQVHRGQVLKMDLESARRKYGQKLTIASLGAISKGERSDGSIEVRIVHDGTNKVDVNKYIRVRDSTPFPLAADIMRVLRDQAGAKRPYFGLTVDVKEAHRSVAIDPLDWPLQACQVTPEGSVYLNKRGTYGIASAAYCWGRLGGGRCIAPFCTSGQMWWTGGYSCSPTTGTSWSRARTSRRTCSCPSWSCWCSASPSAGPRFGEVSCTTGWGTRSTSGSSLWASRRSGPHGWRLGSRECSTTTEY